MGWRFRKSFKLLPGVRLNVLKSGISTSIGGAPFTLNFGSRGVYASASGPGTGVGFRFRLDSGSSDGAGSASNSQSKPPGHGVEPTPPLGPQHALIPVEAEIRSAGTEVITSEGLRAFKEVIRSAFEERTDIGRELDRAQRKAAAAKQRFTSWDSGFLLKRVFVKSFAARRELAVTTADKQAELEEQLRLSTVPLEIHAPKQQLATFARLADDFALLARAQQIWDTTSRQAIDRVAKRSTANEETTRERVSFALGTTDLILSAWKVPHLGNRNGGDLYIYPAFALYRVSNEAFAVIDLEELEVRVEPCNFVEREGVPSDSHVISQAWQKANKDGTPDRRFRDNFQIPVVRYASLSLTTPSGLNEQYLISNVSCAEAFVRSWSAFRASIGVATA